MHGFLVYFRLIYKFCFWSPVTGTIGSLQSYIINSNYTWITGSRSSYSGAILCCYSGRETGRRGGGGGILRANSGEWPYAAYGLWDFTQRSFQICQAPTVQRKNLDTNSISMRHLGSITTDFKNINKITIKKLANKNHLKHYTQNRVSCPGLCLR